MLDSEDSRECVDVVVVGAGVVGLAAARTLALRGLQVVILESATAYGTGTSSRNSEVVHAGLYYPQGSLKATLCVQGRHRLTAYAATHQVPLQHCGKLVVATQADELPKLEAIRARGEACGVDDLQWLTGRQAQALEPELHCVAALHSPSSGIIDSHALMTAYLGDAQQAGALFAVASPFTAAERDGRDWRVHTGGDEPFVLHTRWLVNAAGLQAQAVAHLMTGFPKSAIPTRHLAKGHYFSLARRAPFRRLIYPTPVDGGLGVHLTLDLGGQARFGPDVQWLPPRTDNLTADTSDTTDIDYSVDPTRAAGFEADIRRYWPQLPDGALQPAYSGVRPKLSGPGEPAADFHVAGPAQHGAPGVVQLFGIESPGLTASMALAEHVAELMST
jgi:L-2-hydroxyglutarate oxidase LhgO